MRSGPQLQDLGIFHYVFKKQHISHSSSSGQTCSNFSISKGRSNSFLNKPINQRITPASTLHVSIPWQTKEFHTFPRLQTNRKFHTTSSGEACFWIDGENMDRSATLYRQPYLVNSCIFNYCQFPGLFNEEVHGSDVILDPPKALHGTSKPLTASAQHSYLEYLEGAWEQCKRRHAYPSFQAMWINFGIIQRLINSWIVPRPQWFRWIRCVNQRDNENLHKLSFS